MTNSRQYMLDAFNYNNPSKIPVIFGWSDSGLYTHGQKLIDLFAKHPYDNPETASDFTKIPQPQEGSMKQDGSYHYKSLDEWGTEWEFRIFGIVGHPSKYPFEEWDETEDYKFPNVPEGMTVNKEEDTKNVTKLKETHLVFRGWISVWEKLHSLRPMDEVMMDLCTEEEEFINFLDRLVAHQEKVIQYHLDVGADVIIFGDDWGTQTGPLISPKSFKSIYRPIYKKLFDMVHNAGKKVMFHSCGKLGYILDELLELGIDGIWPQIGSYDFEELTAKLKKHNALMYVHPDRQHLVPNGTTKEIEDAIKMYCEHFKKLGGGAIFNIEVENDAPFENVETLINTVFKDR